MRTRRGATPLVALLAALAGPLSGHAAAGIAGFVKPGKVHFEVRQDGSPVAGGDYEVWIRTRDEDPPPVVIEARNRDTFDLPAGRYDCLITFHHLFMDPIRYHAFEVRADKTTAVVSEVRTHTLRVHPVAAGSPAPERVSEVLIENTISGDRLRVRLPDPLILPEASYRVSVQGRDDGGRSVVRTQTLYLACDADVTVSF